MITIFVTIVGHCYLCFGSVKRRDCFLKAIAIVKGTAENQCLSIEKNRSCSTAKTKVTEGTVGSWQKDYTWHHRKKKKEPAIRIRLLACSCLQTSWFIKVSTIMVADYS